MKARVLFENIIKEFGLTILTRLQQSAYSQSQSHYCTTWDVLAAPFRVWPGAILINRPRHTEFPEHYDVAAELSADDRWT